MSTIGQYIKQARKVRKKTIYDLSQETRIKESFLVAIEKENWKSLPEYPALLGFIKSIANALNLNKENLVAVFRRDYPLQKIEINPLPEPKQDFHWGPRLTFLLSAGVIVLGVIAYLLSQYFFFLTPPKLEIIKPERDKVVTEKTLEVSGTTEPDASVFVNTQPAYVDDDGRFYTEIEILPQTTKVEVVSKSRSGKETKKEVNITVQENN